jgi:hypothetical protein
MARTRLPYLAISLLLNRLPESKELKIEIFLIRQSFGALGSSLEFADTALAIRNICCVVGALVPGSEMSVRVF